MRVILVTGAIPTVTGRQAGSQPASQPEGEDDGEDEGATDASQSQLAEGKPGEPGDGGWC